MKFSIRVTGGEQARGKLAELGDRLKNLAPAFLRSSVVVLTAAQGHIRDQGPGWPPEAIPNDQGSLLYRTGALFRSLQLGGPENISEEIAGGMRVGTRLKTPDGQYSIGQLMQYGTGPIRPKHGSLLVFEINGVKIFSRGTKGIPPRRFLYWDSTTANQALGVFSSYIMDRPMGATPTA